LRKVHQVKIDKITIPGLSVTSQFDQDILMELEASIKESGIKIPLLLMKVKDTLYLIDGLHRLEVAKRLGMDKVPCIIKEGSETDLLIENLIVNRQRGKSNPIDEMKVIKHLRENEDWSFKEIAKALGMSPFTAKTYYDLTRLPREVLSLIEGGLLGTVKAYYLLRIPNHQDQIRAANTIVKYGLPEREVIRLINDILRSYEEPPIVRRTLKRPEEEELIHCEICYYPMHQEATYHWICDNCWNQIERAIESKGEKHGGK